MSSAFRSITAAPSVRTQNPLFRRLIIPWYDTEPVCYFTLIFTAVTIVFSLAGIFEANSIAYKQYLWVPTLLFAMSIVVFSSTILRLIRRGSERKFSN